MSKHWRTLRERMQCVSQAWPGFWNGKGSQGGFRKLTHMRRHHSVAWEGWSGPVCKDSNGGPLFPTQGTSAPSPSQQWACMHCTPCPPYCHATDVTAGWISIYAWEG